jgi:hypothetical protein
MRIALCLFGNVGHKQMQGVRKKEDGYDAMAEAFNPKGTWTRPEHACRSFQMALKPHDVDVFIHSWSIDFAAELLGMYAPVGHEIVTQKRFGSQACQYGLIGEDMSQWDLPAVTMASYELLLPSRKTVKVIVDEMQELTFRTESRWWSSKRVLELKREYERGNGFTYDFVVVSRLDNMFKKPIPFTDLDPAKFYGSRRVGRPDEQYAYFDYWFVSGSENMDGFATLFDERYEYSIRPTFACRQHVVRTLGEDAVRFLFRDKVDYILVRDLC